jgi:hypothetical protein
VPDRVNARPVLVLAPVAGAIEVRVGPVTVKADGSVIDPEDP